MVVPRGQISARKDECILPSTLQAAEIGFDLRHRQAIPAITVIITHAGNLAHCCNPRRERGQRPRIREQNETKRWRSFKHVHLGAFSKCVHDDTCKTRVHPRTYTRVFAYRRVPHARAATRTTILYQRHLPDSSSLPHMFYQQLFHVTPGRNRTDR